MNPVIVYRDDIDWKQEADVAKKYFPCYNSRILVKPNDLVIARFSALPFFKEQETDYKLIGAKMINDSFAHNYVADLQNWYFDLQELTPQTWNRCEDLPDEGPFVLKGETNSKKFLWDTHMFAKNKKEAINVYSKLLEDSMLQYQKIYIRKYIPLKTFSVGFHGLPITNEFRFFIYKGHVLSGGYYWSCHIDDLAHKPNINEVPKGFLNKVIEKIGDNCDYYAVDVAETANGDWVVIELNDGTMSGLSENDPDELYGNLSRILNDQNNISQI